jgi:hypothetical protein
MIRQSVLFSYYCSLFLIDTEHTVAVELGIALSWLVELAGSTLYISCPSDLSVALSPLMFYIEGPSKL